MLPSHLVSLEKSGLIRLAQVQPELAYLFRHVLVRDATYHSLLKADRRELHQLIGETFEKLVTDQLEEFAPILAHHFTEAGEATRAVGYHLLAAEAAARHYAHAEAIWHYTQARQFIAQTPLDRLRDLFLGLGRILEHVGQAAAAAEGYAQLAALAHERATRDPAAPRVALAALLAHATLFCAPTALFNPAQGRALSEQTLRLARAQGDRHAEAKSFWNLALVCKFTGQDEQLVAYGEQALAVARELGLREQVAFVLNDISFGYASQLKMAQGVQALHEARDLWESLKNQPMLADSLTGLALMGFLTGDLPLALANVQRAHEISRAINNEWGLSYSAWHLGTLKMAVGEWAEAFKYLEEAVYFGRRVGFQMALLGAAADWAELHGELGDLDTALSLARAALLTADEHIPAWRAWPLNVLLQLLARRPDDTVPALLATAHLQHGNLLTQTLIINGKNEMLLALQQPREVIAIATDTLTWLQPSGLNTVIGLMWLTRGRAFGMVGQWAEAESDLRAAWKLTSANGARYWQWRIAQAMLPIAAAQGHTADHAHWHSLARDLTQFLADHAPAERRAAFLARPEAQALLT